MYFSFVFKYLVCRLHFLDNRFFGGEIMSFRVWFLRMVWIVAAAVALSGCPGDDDGNENGTDGKGDGPSLAIGKIGNVTMGDGNEKATIKVTITSKDDADKTAEVTLTVMCGEEVVAVADKGEMKAVGGVATYKDVDLGKHEKAVDCTADASATLGGKEVKATQVKFEIVTAKVTGASVTAVSFLNSDDKAFAPDSSTAITEVDFVAKKIKVTLSKALVTSESIVLSWACTAANNDAIAIATQPAYTLAADADNAKIHTVDIGTDLNTVLVAANNTAKCTVTAKVGSEAGMTADIWVTGAD